MAEPILLKLPPRDPREALYQRLENAAHEHAEALLTTYDIVQGLHDRGILELAKSPELVFWNRWGKTLVPKDLAAHSSLA